MPLFLADDLKSNPPPEIPSLIGRGILPERGRLLMVGRTGIGKTLLALDLAFSLVLAEPLWRAFRPPRANDTESKPYFPVFRPCRVLYLDAELGPYGMHERLVSFYAHRAPGFELGPYFHIVSGEFDYLSLSSKRGILNFNKLLEVHNAETVDAANGAPLVVIIDPIGDFHNLDENDNMIRVVWNSLRELQQKHKFAAIAIHHETDKQVFDAQGRTIIREGTGRSRGHSATPQAMDTMIAFRQENEQPYTFMEVRWEKARRRAQAPPGLLFVDKTRMYIQWVAKMREATPAIKNKFMTDYRAQKPLDAEALEY